ncbi:MAG: aminotransferase class V-fold PLP-dependent enzyme, partial [Oscillospiraceae bacterium]|nr:aminotransferase class V-fold PLP-dependent enzyme [Oscillospiraceae bacterium]
RFINGISRIDGIRIYRENGGNYAPIVSFNAEGFTPNELASLLSDDGIYLRGGLHCSGMAHTALGTAPNGTLRFAPSVFNNVNQVDELIYSLKKILKKP